MFVTVFLTIVYCVTNNLFIATVKKYRWLFYN